MVLDDATKRDLRARHVAWTKAKLLSQEGKAALRANLEQGFRAVMSSPVERVIDLEALVRVVEHVASAEVLARTVRPLVRTALLLEMGRLREEPAPLGTYVPHEARALVEQLLQQPDLLPEKFVREVLSHKAFEEVMRDVLDGALREFSEKIDPFKAEWGLPSLLKKAGPLSMFAKGFDVVRKEFEARLEPERKRFLQGFARKSLDMVADFTVKRADDPQFVALRKELFAWLLEQPVSELVAQASEPVVDLSEGIGHAVAKHVTSLEATKRRRRAQLELLFRAHASETLEQALLKYGARVEPDFDAIADAVWPAIEAAMQTEAVDRFLDEVVGGFYDTV